MTHPYLDQTVSDIVTTVAGATRVFHDYGIDFCRDGAKTLAQVAHDQMLDVTAVLAGLDALDGTGLTQPDWSVAPPADLIDHLVQRFHARHREQLPELIRLSRRVEMVHAGKPGCPSGLADVLEDLFQELESHMLKEERILFPMLAQGAAQQARTPISVMLAEHDHHQVALDDIMTLTGKISAPAGACNTWRALYTGLQEFREDLMEHIHLENNILFINPSNVGQGAVNG